MPASAWLRASILWADDLAAIWPADGRPTPFSATQERSLEEMQLLRQADLFKPQFIFDLPYSAPLARAIDAAVLPDSAPRDEAWQDGGSAVGPPISASTGPRPREDVHDRFIYQNKLPEWATDLLRSRHMLEPRPPGTGYVLASADAVDRLLAAYATVLCETFGGRLVPDVEEPAQARRIAAPSHAGGSRQAVVLTLRGAVTPDLQTDFRRFIDFRLDAGHERARRDYIEHLTALWDLFARGGEDHAAEQTIAQVTNDLRKARDSYFKRVSKQTLIAQGLVSLGVVLPLLAADPVAAVAAAAASVAGSVITVTVRNDAPKFIRNATKAELLATVGGI